jgi:hypothetical protein
MTVTSGRSPRISPPIGTSPTPPAAPANDAAGNELRGNALRLWLLTRLALLVTVSAGAWLVTSARHLHHAVPFSALWKQWDTNAYVQIAHWGYRGDPSHPASAHLDGLFPGLPMTMRALHAVFGVDYAMAGLLISFVAGGVAVVALARIATLAGEPDLPAAALGERTVLLFLLAPSAIFLMAAYPESLFLALALPAWLAAKRRAWHRAGVLAAGAALTNPIGVCLAAALIVEFLTADHPGRRRRVTPALVLPFLPVLGFLGYVHHRTGHWWGRPHAAPTGGANAAAWPWDGLRHTLDAAAGGRFTTDWTWMFRLELVAAMIGLALLIFLVRNRRWSESVFVGLQLVAVTSAYWWTSIPRAALTWWPLWVALAAWSLRSPRVFQAYLFVVAPFMFTLALAFTNGRWAG